MSTDTIFAERMVIGTILQDSDYARTAVEQLTPEHFTDEKCRKVFSAMRQVEGDIDIISVSNMLKIRSDFESVGGTPYLADLLEGVVTTVGAEGYIKTLLANYVIRRNHKILAQADQCLKNHDIKKAQKTLMALDFGEDEGQDKSIKEIANEFSNYLHNANERHIELGFKDLDKKIGGLHGGDLVIIAARPAMGKSAFAVNIMENVVLDDEIPTLLFSFEMSDNQIFTRLVSSYSGIPIEDIMKKTLSTEDQKKVDWDSAELSNEKFYMYDRADLATVAGVSRVAREEKRKHDIQLIIIDYLQLMSAYEVNGDTRNNEISKITRGLKLLAKELDIPIILLSQLSRASEKRTEKRPMLSDLRDSGAIEQDADIVMFLHRPDYYGESGKEGICEVNIAKHRQGPTGTIELVWLAKTTCFKNLEWGLLSVA